MSEKEIVCDFHVHTTNSDGELTVEQVVDLYGKHGFDAIAVTDHFLDREYAEKAEEEKDVFPGVRKEKLEEYFQKIREERKRALKKYGMIVIPGIEYTNYTVGRHIIGLDCEKFIAPSEPVEKIVDGIKSSGGLAVACHPADEKSVGRHEGATFLADNIDRFREVFDLWEIGNRNELFSHVGEEDLDYIASSDFHSRKHLETWKTVLKCEKTVEGIKKALEENRNVKIMKYSGSNLHGSEEVCSNCNDCGCE